VGVKLLISKEKAASNLGLVFSYCNEFEILRIVLSLVMTGKKHEIFGIRKTSKVF
jgi:hypothetical protein